MPDPVPTEYPCRDVQFSAILQDYDCQVVCISCLIPTGMYTLLRSANSFEGSRLRRIGFCEPDWAIPGLIPFRITDV
jgi:hypothetical protein